MKFVPVTSRSWPWMPYAIDMESRRRKKTTMTRNLGLKLAKEKK